MFTWSSQGSSKLYVLRTGRQRQSAQVGQRRGSLLLCGIFKKTFCVAFVSLALPSLFVPFSFVWVGPFFHTTQSKRAPFCLGGSPFGVPTSILSPSPRPEPTKQLTSRFWVHPTSFPTPACVAFPQAFHGARAPSSALLSRYGHVTPGQGGTYVSKVQALPRCRGAPSVFAARNMEQSDSQMGWRNRWSML